VEKQIETLESKNQEIDELLTREEIYTDVAKCIELNQEKTTILEELETLYVQWEELA
jgi:ATP-binding cassette subfamily F protein 3